jgi:excisionase family DNA binding protein
MTQEPLFLTVREATDRLNKAGMQVTRDAVQRWCREKQIPTVTLPGGHYRIRVKDIDALLVPQPVSAQADVA